LEASASISALGLLAWFESIKKYFIDFKPETRTVVVNYTKKTSTIELAIHIGQGFRKKHRKIKLPIYENYKISKMKDESFHELKFLWRVEDNQWVLDAKKLPSSEWFLIEMEGVVEEKALEDLVHIKPAINRDSDEENDRYWLDSSLKNPTILDKLWHASNASNYHFPHISKCF